MITRCILGSQSPRRKQLMETMGFPFEVMVSDAEEDFPESMPVHEVACFVATKKAKVLLPFIPDHSVLVTADSTVICGGKIYNKPENREEAIQMLTDLSGKEHEVVTGVWIGHHKEELFFSESTFVTFAELSTEETEFYVDNFKPYDKAGAYGIQDWIGTTSVISIKGSYTNVMGLPTHAVYKVLKKYFK
jgi:septum formation protein